MKNFLIRTAALAVLAVMLVGMVSCGYSYLEEENITAATSFDKAKFDAITVTLPKGYEVTDEDVEQAIRETFFAKKTQVNGGKSETSGIIGDGDNVRLWYIGTVDLGDGKTEIVRDTASGMTFSNMPYWYVVGGGALRIEALEDALNGVDIASYLAESKGTVKPDMTYFLSYYFNDYDADGKQISGSTIKYDGVNRVTTEELVSKFDDGFKEAFEANVIGKSFDIAKADFFKLTVDGKFPNGGVKREYSVRVCGQTANELTVEGTFDDDGGKYAGKKVSLRVQLFEFVDYEVQELNEETAVSVFKIDKEKYPDPVAEVRRQVKEMLLNDSTRLQTLNDAIWSALLECVTIKELPKAKVKEMYKVFLRTVKDYYREAQSEDLYEEFVNTYGADAMKSLDAFAAAMLEGNPGERAEDIVMGKAESWVSEDLVVFSILFSAGLDLPTPEEVEAEVDADLATIIKETGNTEEELYEMYGGREYFIANTYRVKILELMRERVKIEYRDIEK